MPELPEIETIASDIRATILKTTIFGAEVKIPKLRHVLSPNIAKSIINSVVVDVVRRAKYLIIKLSNNNNIVLHLGMSGSLLLTKAHYELRKHDHVIISLDNGRTLIFNDPRKFGMIAVVSDDELTGALSHLGHEPQTLDLATFMSLLKTKNDLKTVLTNSRIIAGIGNIYASEILFHAKLNPLRSAITVGYEEAARLLNSIKHILSKAVMLRGSTIKDYRDSSGASGGYQKVFLVYDRENLPCTLCAQLIKKIKQHSRATYMCCACQS